jgi:hypothetical protein
MQFIKSNAVVIFGSLLLIVLGAYKYGVSNIPAIILSLGLLLCLTCSIGILVSILNGNFTKRKFVFLILFACCGILLVLYQKQKG